jgi:hypothetical protein
VDGDFDAFVGDENGNLYYFENTGTPTAPEFAAPALNSFGLEVGAGPVGRIVPAFVDIDNDGDFDLFVGDENGDLWFYENTNL